MAPAAVISEALMTAEAPPIVLASASRTRARLLSQAGYELDFD